MVIENDSIRVAYSFNGENCPIQIQVNNKLEKPIYVDWKKSALILEGERFSYWKDKTVINASSRSYEVRWTNVLSTSSTSTQGELVRPEQISFIPPHSFIKVSLVTARDSFFKLPKPDQSQKVILITGEQPSSGYRYTFSKENSPFKFRSYLTLSLSEDFIQPFHFDDEFWGSQIITTGVSPSQIGSTNNQFSLRKTSGLQKNNRHISWNSYFGLGTLSEREF